MQADRVTVTEVDKKIAESDFFLCLWTENCAKDEQMLGQVATAIRLKKPFIVARKKGAKFPSEIRKKARIVSEFEWSSVEELKSGLTDGLRPLMKRFEKED